MQLINQQWPLIDKLAFERTILMIAIGPTEQHGPMGPLGTDIFIAEWMMQQCAGELVHDGYDIVIAPTVPYINAFLSREYPGSVSIGKEVTYNYVKQVLTSFARNGFRHIVVTSQHLDPPWLQIIEQICRELGVEHGARCIHGFERLVYDFLLSEDGHQLAGDLIEVFGTHAGIGEIAPLLYICPHTVDHVQMGTLPNMPISFEELRRARTFRTLGNGLGYTGDVKRCTPELGEAILNHYRSRYLAILRRWLKGEDVAAELELAHVFYGAS